MKRGFTDWSQLPLILTVDHLSVVLMVSTSQIRRMLASGQLKGVKCGREWRVTKNDLIKFCEGGEN